MTTDCKIAEKEPKRAKSQKSASQSLVCGKSAKSDDILPIYLLSLCTLVYLRKNLPQIVINLSTY